MDCPIPIGKFHAKSPRSAGVGSQFVLVHFLNNSSAQKKSFYSFVVTKRQFTNEKGSFWSKKNFQKHIIDVKFSAEHNAVISFLK